MGLDEDMARAANGGGEKKSLRTDVGGVIRTHAYAGTLRLTDVLGHHEPARTLAVEVLTDVADGAPADFGLAQGLTVRLLIGKASPDPSPSKPGWPHKRGHFRCKTLVIETHPAPKVVRHVPQFVYFQPGSVQDVAPARAAFLLARHGYGLEEAHGIKHVHVLELGYSIDGVYHRTVTDEAEAAFRESQGLAPAEPASEPEPPRRGPGRPPKSVEATP